MSDERLNQVEQWASTEPEEVERITRELIAEVRRLRRGLSKQNADICQTLGKALGYPWFKDHQKDFPGATEANGVCVGDHVAESLADEAARRIRELEAAVEGVMRT